MPGVKQDGGKKENHGRKEYIICKQLNLICIYRVSDGVK
jgi:hypothetical protein